MGKKGWLAALLPSVMKLSCAGIFSLGLLFSLSGQEQPVSIVPRPKALEKAEVLPKANIRVDSTRSIRCMCQLAGLCS